MHSPRQLPEPPGDRGRDRDRWPVRRLKDRASPVTGTSTQTTSSRERLAASLSSWNWENAGPLHADRELGYALFAWTTPSAHLDSAMPTHCCPGTPPPQAPIRRSGLASSLPRWLWVSTSCRPWPRRRSANLPIGPTRSKRSPSCWMITLATCGAASSTRWICPDQGPVSDAIVATSTIVTTFMRNAAATANRTPPARASPNEGQPDHQ